jgi:FtsH-binding integral membrane protein
MTNYQPSNGYPTGGYPNAGARPSENYISENPVSVSEKARRASVTGVYGQMTLALLVTFGVAWLTAASGLAYRFLVATGIVGVVILAVVQIGLAIALSSRVMTMKVSTAYTLFYVFAVTMGFSLSTIFYAYDSTSILITLGLCAGFFFCLTMIGLGTHVNMLSWGSILGVGLLVLIVAEIIISFIPGATMAWKVVSAIGLALFAIMTARDAQTTRTLLNQCTNDAMTKRVSIIAALELYLDFVNLFQYLLALLGSSSDN